MAKLLDAFGRPMQPAILKTEIAAATLGGVRSPLTSYPADGMSPQRLASILREADAGDAIRYLELAETIEERDLHYLGVLGARRRAVCQLDATVEAASDDPEDEADAQMIRDWLNRDELTDEMFHILDCIGKGFSATEIIWDTSSGQWMPERLEHRDPRWFEFDREDLSTPLLRGASGMPEPLPGGKFIWAQIAAKSGLPLRSGIARVAAWAWMFKAFTQRDWTIFTQTYGQPVRLGKYASGATEADKTTLMRAVSNIAGDMAAIIPDSMSLELIVAGNIGAASGLYKERCDWLDQQVSKAVLGQTATTDAVTGGLGSGKEHRQVQEDIERSDARALSAILNRDLIRPWIMLNRGPRDKYPRIKIARPEDEDLSAFASAIGPMIDRGFQVSQAAVRSKFGLPEPKAGEVLMTAMQSNSPPSGPLAADVTDPSARDREIKRNPDEIKRGPAFGAPVAALNAEGAPTGLKSAPSSDDVLAGRMMVEGADATEAMLARIEAMVGAAGSMDELRAMLLQGFPQVPVDELAAILGMGLTAANLGGRVAAAEEADQ